MLTERARRNAVPVVENRNAEQAVADVIGLVLDAAERVQRPS